MARDVDSPFAWVYSPYTLLMVLILATGLGVTVVASTSTASFDPFNAGWDGASDLRSEATSVDADTTVLRSTSEYGGLTPGSSVAVVLAPDEGYTQGEANRVESFVESGGTLVVAEDIGPHGNDLLAAVGADARVDGRRLRDERYNYRSPALPVARNVSDHPLTDGVNRLTLNYGTAVDPDGATTLVRTSPYAYLDRNGNGQLDDPETLGRYPVATVESVGEGQVVVLGDPSLVINAMVERNGNQRFFGNLFDGAATVALDYSNARNLPPLRVAVLTLREQPIVRIVVGVLFVGVVGVTTAYGRSLRRSVARFLEDDVGTPPTVSAEEVLTYVREEHPEWDDKRRERVTKNVLSTRDDDSKIDE